MANVTVYGSMFSVAFLAATVFPAQSEALLTYFLLQKEQSVWLLIAVASIGNVAGSIVNWILGRGIDRFHDRSWFPLKPAMRVRAQGWYARYGRWSLLLSWVPVMGDALTVAAGIMGEKLMVFITLVAIAKTGRYLVVAAIVLGLSDQDGN